MGPRSRLILLLLAACRTAPVAPPSRPEPDTPVAEPTPIQPARPDTMEERVVADFENATLSSKDAYVALFDFTAVGEMEILLHRYDLLGRLPNLPDDIKAQFAAEDGTPYPAEREKINVTGFYGILAQRTVGTGGCTAGAPRTRYGKLLGQLDAFPAGTPDAYETLRAKAAGYVAKGGVVALWCKGGRGGIALVWTERPNSRGYDLITIYDD